MTESARPEGSGPLGAIAIALVVPQLRTVE
jgi:hypothetical protein